MFVKIFPFEKYFSWRVLVRAGSYSIHGLIPTSSVFADRYNREEVVASLGREINLNPPLTLGQLPDTSEELLKLDQVHLFISNRISMQLVMPDKCNRTKLKVQSLLQWLLGIHQIWIKSRRHLRCRESVHRRTHFGKYWTYSTI